MLQMEIFKRKVKESYETFTGNQAYGLKNYPEMEFNIDNKQVGMISFRQVSIAYGDVMVSTGAVGA